MFDRRRMLAGLAFAAGLALVPAMAAEPIAFSSDAFETAKSSGKSVLVEVTAPWCPTCKAQKPILSELRAQPKFKDVVVFSVDFDSQKDALRVLNAQRQSTLIAFKGTREVGRSVGDTNKASIEALVAKSL